MAREPKEIIQFIRSKSDYPMRIKELAKAMDISDSEYPAFRRTVKKLIDSGDLVKLKRGRIGPADQLNVVVGAISVNRSGTGFVPRDGDEPDVLIPPPDVGTAIDGDKVMVRLTGKVQGRQAGTVIRVLERARRNIVGVFHTGRTFSYVVPDNPRIQRDIYINPEETLGAENGEKVVAVLTAWENPYLNPEGRVTERIGFPGQPGVDMLAVIKSFNLPEAFPDEVIDEAEEAAAIDLSDEFARRQDHTKRQIYTIDPEDAKDHDDAVTVERTGTGYRLGVYIADVSFFVREGTALDKEAFERGNSVYLPGMVIPMLPEALSNDVCSLRPNRRRLAHGITIEFDSHGKMLDWTIFDAVINSRAKLSYEEVQHFFDGGEVTQKTKRIGDNLVAARELAQILTQRRFSEGSLDFDLPEAKIIMDEKGEVIELRNRIRLEAHRLVEEFMLAANRAVALDVFRRAKPFLYRVHAKPDMEKLEGFSYLVGQLGYKFPVSPNMRPIQFARFLDKIKDTPEADFINELMLRSMQKAVYQRENIGHFGLAFAHYTHFTSPIRRYPDLIVHRLLRKLREGKYTAPFARRVISVIDHVGEHCSETERVAETAERQAVKIKQVQYMANRLGDEFNGVISGVMPYGFFVRLESVGVEGLVRMSSIDDDYYNYDERHYRITGRRHGRSFRLGDQVRVGVLKVDTVRNEVDLFLAEKKREAKAKKQPVKMSKSKGIRKNDKRKRTKSTRAEPKKKRTGRRRKK